MANMFWHVFLSAEPMYLCLYMLSSKENVFLFKVTISYTCQIAVQHLHAKYVEISWFSLTSEIIDKEI